MVLFKNLDRVKFVKKSFFKFLIFNSDYSKDIYKKSEVFKKNKYIYVLIFSSDIRDKKLKSPVLFLQKLAK